MKLVEFLTIEIKKFGHFVARLQTKRLHGNCAYDLNEPKWFYYTVTNKGSLPFNVALEFGIVQRDWINDVIRWGDSCTAISRIRKTSKQTGNVYIAGYTVMSNDRTFVRNYPTLKDAKREVIERFA
jgi:hypothetical protein